MIYLEKPTIGQIYFKLIQISSIEYQLLGKDEEWFKLKTIGPCTEADEDSWIENIYKSQYHDKEIDDMIHCEKWTLNIADQREETYKVQKL